jgi:radical SAM superfamily enzyme YgiQ (UPF0313 family)
MGQGRSYTHAPARCRKWPVRVAVVSVYVHPTRLPLKERSVMQSAVPELIAGLLPRSAQVELIHEKERPVPLDLDCDLIFFSYLHSGYEHAKALSAVFRTRGALTVAGGRHASHFVHDCMKYFDVVVVGEPEGNVGELIADFERGELKPVYSNPSPGPGAIRPYRHDLTDFRTNPYRLPAIEASRGCPFGCNFCVLTGHEHYRCRPVHDVIDEIQYKLAWNRGWLRHFDKTFMFFDNNLGGSIKYLRELCEALIPLKKSWGCSLTFNVLCNKELVRLLARAGCRYIYTGLEALNADSVTSMNKRQNLVRNAAEVIRHTYSQGILLTFGLILGSDGDTNEYCERLPEYLHDLGAHAVSYLGIVCPYPETPLFHHLTGEGRILPDVISRDLDGYTLCHRPKKMSPSELVEHYIRLSRTLNSVRNVVRHYWDKLFLSNRPYYKSAIAVSGRELVSIKNAVDNPARTFVAGYDAVEKWDAEQAIRFGLPFQTISPVPNGNPRISGSGRVASAAPSYGPDAHTPLPSPRASSTTRPIAVASPRGWLTGIR